MKRIGLIVNPIAGMGGSVGLKGTDGGMYRKAVELGAAPVTPNRSKRFLSSITRKSELLILAAPDEMGEKHAEECGVNYTVTNGKVQGISSPEDTKRVTGEMVRLGAELIVFVGGDGTARDIYNAVDAKIPVLGVPAGVKMYSSVFAVNPEAAAQIIDAFLAGEAGIVDGEVLDVNEEAYRRGQLDIELYGSLKVPKTRELIQPGKEPTFLNGDAEENQKAIASYIAQNADEDTLYLLGPGSTLKAIADELKVEKTLLGVDATYRGQRVGEDLNEKGIQKLLQSYPKAKIIVSPIGGQGFIFGRGNQQFTPQILKSIGKDNIIVVSTKDKIRELRRIRVDTGDKKLDEKFRGYIQVIVDYNVEVLKKVNR